MDYVIGPKDGFSENLAKEFGCEYIEIERRVFPDFESMLRILMEEKNLKGKEVLLVSRQKSGKEANPNRYLIEMFFAVKNLAGMGANVNVLMPYFVYSMQDKVFRAGEPLSAAYTLEFFKNAGAKKLFVVSSHMQRKEGRLEYYKDLEAYNISAFKTIAEYIKNNYELERPFVLGPDLTASADAQEVATVLGGSTDSIKKTRDVETY